MKKVLFFGLALGLFSWESSSQLVGVTGANTYYGVDAGSTTSAAENVGIGRGALDKVAGARNTALGYYALGSFLQTNDMTGIDNCALGAESMQKLISGNYNVAVGSKSLHIAEGGSNNVVIGKGAYYNRYVGDNNIVLGFETSPPGNSSAVSSNNVIIGTKLALGSTPFNNTIVIGTYLTDIRLLIDSQGRAGLGTTAPKNKLDIEGNLAVGAAYSGTTAAPANGAIIQGSVGIGNNSPNNKLEVTTGTTGSSGLRFTNLKSDYVVPTGTAAVDKVLTVNENGDVVMRKISPAGAEVDGDVTNEIQYLVKTGSTLELTQSGNYIGAGTNISLTGTGTSGDPFVFNYDGPGAGTFVDTSIYGGDGSLTSSRVVHLNGNNLAFDTGSANQIFIGNAPTISAANFASGYKLLVDSGIMTEKVKVALNGSSEWPDYVFEEGYNLMPLADLEAYFKQNKHLPNVPSAKDLEREGIDLGKMQSAQMEKIEELTLYIVAQEHKIKEQEAEINALKVQAQKLRELEKKVEALMSNKR